MFYVLCFTWPEHWFTWNITHIYHSFLWNLCPVHEVVLCFMSYVLYKYHLGIPLSFLAHCVSYEKNFMFLSCWIEVILLSKHVLCFMFYMTKTLFHMKYNPHLSFFFCQIYAWWMKWFYVLCLMFYIYHVEIPLTFLAHCVSYESSFMFISCWIEVILVTQHVLRFMFYMSHMICMPYNPFTIILTLKIW